MSGPSRGPTDVETVVVHRKSVPGSSSGQLTLIMSLKGSSKPMNHIARELALDMGDAAFKPDLLSHTPGVASSIADILSRKSSPQSKFDVPDILRGAPEVFPSQRDHNGWKSL